MSYFAVKMSILPSIRLWAYMDELATRQEICLEFVNFDRERITRRLFENSPCYAFALILAEGFSVVGLTIACSIRS